jgi:hypothetical protein
MGSLGERDRRLPAPNVKYRRRVIHQQLAQLFAGHVLSRRTGELQSDILIGAHSDRRSYNLHSTKFALVDERSVVEGAGDAEGAAAKLSQRLTLAMSRFLLIS